VACSADSAIGRFEQSVAQTSGDFAAAVACAINGLFPIRGIGFSVCLMKEDQSALMILMVTDQSVIGGKGSLVEVQLFYPLTDATPENLQAEYDLASLGEVERVRGHYGDPLKWMVEYKGKVSAKRGDQIKPKA